MREIGSDFWDVEKNRSDIQLFLSGRTALEFIIRDILMQDNKIQSVAMPSYCCDSMLEPFQRHGISIRFYDVVWERSGLGITLPTPEDNEIFFLIRYFGFSCLQGLDVDYICENWKFVIEDDTHSWLSEQNRDYSVDYRFISHRKWAGFGGIATAAKNSGVFLPLHTSVQNVSYDKLRDRAEVLKKQYVENGHGTKDEFLELFHRSEKLLETDYMDYSPSIEAIQKLANFNSDYAKRRRRENAEFLIKNVNDILGIELMYTKMDEDDVPLCVPVLVDYGIRNKLRKHLISNKVYCPVHWPLSRLHNGISGSAKDIYDKELSLVCDQRYTTDDMRRELEVIKKLLRKLENDKNVYFK